VKAADELHDPFSRRQTNSTPTFVKPKAVVEDQATEQPPSAQANTNKDIADMEVDKQLSQPAVAPLAPDHPEILLKSAHDFDIELPSKPTERKKLQLSI
jgi:hypothetical protein